MGSAKKWLFSASISLAFVAGCIPANAQGGNKVRFNNKYDSGYSGTVWGTQDYPGRQINIKVFSNSIDNNMFDLEKFWNIHDTDGNEFSASGQKLDLDQFNGMPTLQFYGDWSRAYTDVIDGNFSLDGDISNFDNVFIRSLHSYDFEGVQIVCVEDENTACGQWVNANRDGVKVTLSGSQGLFGNLKIFAQHPNAIGEIEPVSCFEQDGLGVKVPTNETCTTDEDKLSGTYTSLKVEDEGTLILGGNLILEEGFTSFEVENNALVKGSGGLVKTGPQTTVLKGTGTFAYEGDVFVQGGVLDIQNPTALGSVVGVTTINNGASLQLSLTGSKDSNGNYKEISFDEPLVIDGGTIVFPGNKTPKGDSSDDLGSHISLKGPIQVFDKATFKTSISQTADDGYRQARISATVSGEGDFVKSGNGSLLIRDADFGGFTGNFFVTEGLLALGQDEVIPKVSNVAISKGAKVTMYSQTMNQSIASLTGEGVWAMFYEGQKLHVGNNEASSLNKFKGQITGSGSIVKDGTNTLELSGSNTYTGSTTIENGTIMLGSKGGIPQSSVTSIKAGATLDLNNEAPSIDSVTLNGGAGSGTLQEMMFNTATITGGALTGTITSNGGLLSAVSAVDLNVEIGRTFIRDMKSGTPLGDVTMTGGQLWIANRNLDGKSQSVVVDDFTLASKTIANPVAPTSASFSNNILEGLVIGFDSQKDYSLVVSGDFKYESGNVYLYKPAESSNAGYEGVWNAIDFDKSDLTDAEYESLFSNTFVLYQDPEGGYTDFGFKSDGESDDSSLIRPVRLEKGSLRVCVGAVFSEDCGGLPPGNSTSDEIADEIEKEVLGGGSSGSGGGSIDFDDDALEGIADEFELWTADELVEVVQRGLLPRNVDGPGQTLATYNNLLADTIFERTPMRQFREVEPEVAVEPEAAVMEPEVEPVPVGEPVRGLWSKSGAVDDVEADAYLAEKTSEQPLVIADAQTAADHDAQHLIEINGKTYAEDDSLTAEYAGRDGVRGWFRGFGGQSADSNGESGTIYNPYGISAGGGIVGADVSLSESFQLGAYASYGDINLWQSSGVEGLGGGWNADGWGGGVTADYWTNNFYVQGLLGASGFSGEQKRSIKGYGVLFDDETAKGEKSASTMVGALRIGAPFQSGSTYFEPQFTATWSGNNENRFSESADDERLGLTYKSRNTNYLQTALGMKFAWPIKTGDTGLLTPSVKLAWLGDWDMGNEDQTIGFDFTDKTYSVGSNQENVNGALIEAGLDYNVAKVEGTSVKAYLRGGAEVWGGNRGTQWRASGGVTFQF